MDSLHLVLLPLVNCKKTVQTIRQNRTAYFRLYYPSEALVKGNELRFLETPHTVIIV